MELLDLVHENRLEDGLLDEDLKAAFSEIIAKNVKPKVYSVTYTVVLSASSCEGQRVPDKEAVRGGGALGVSVLYEGAPHYKIMAEGPSYADAEGKIKEAQQVLQKYSPYFSISIKK